MKERLQKMLGERTLALIKPDAVVRGLIGVICQRFEQAGLKIVACKMIFPTKKLLDGHFPKSEDWVRGMGENTLETYREYQIDPVEILGTADALAIGQKIKEWNYRYLTLGPVMVMVLEGIHAVDMVRKLIGHTLPYKAAPGTIRGDFSINAPDLANVVGSACKNLVHASGTIEEAEQEIANWFSPAELVAWQKTDEFVHFVLGCSTQFSNRPSTHCARWILATPPSMPTFSHSSTNGLATTSRRSDSDARPSLFSTSVGWSRWKSAPRAMWSSREWRFPISSIRMWCGIACSPSISKLSKNGIALFRQTMRQGFSFRKRKAASFG